MREWVERALARCQLSAAAEGYLLSRGAKPSIIEEWGITTWEPAPDDDPAPGEEFRKRYGTHGEFFEDRIIIPLYGPRGRLLGWDSRVVGEKKASRYLIYDRPWAVCFIGLRTALPFIWAGLPVWIVEGAFDVFAMHHALPNSPTLGTGPARLNYPQLEFLRRFAKEVRLAFDQDDTGRKGMERALKDLRKRRVECQVIPYGRDGDDQGSIWDRGGARAMQRAFPYTN